MDTSVIYDIAKCVGMVGIALEGAFLASNILFHQLAKRRTNSSVKGEKTAMLLGYQNKYEQFLMYLGDIGPVNYYFSRKGEVEVIKSARVADLERVLADPTYDNIVLLGHGGTQSWQDSTDEGVSYSDLKTTPKKRVLQMTCGSTGEESSLVALCAKNKEQSFCPVRPKNSKQDHLPRNTIDNYFIGMKLLLTGKLKTCY